MSSADSDASDGTPTTTTVSPAVSSAAAGSAEESAVAFRSFGLDARLYKAIVSRLSFGSPTTIQSKFIPLALQGKDICTRARTGSGKTLAYSIPVIQKILANEAAADSEGRGKKLVHAQRIQALVLVPSKELCKQTYAAMKELLHYCSETVTITHLAVDSLAVQEMYLKKRPDIVISTPARIAKHIQSETISLKDAGLETLVLDEADLLLSLGYFEDIKTIVAHIPKMCQTFLMSATLNVEVDNLKSVVLHQPALLTLQEGESTELPAQFYLRISTARDKNLVLYALLKLKLCVGKTIFFVNSVERCYQLKLVLEQFCVRAGVLNAELPANSRTHIVEQFNRGIFENLIATDESTSMVLTAAANEPVAKAQDKRSENPSKKKAEEKSEKDSEYSSARGVDFKDVRNVINVDFPLNERSYTHRIGRTARGGQHGTALSFVLSDDPDEQQMLAAVQREQPNLDGEKQPQQLPLDLAEIEPLRYRVNDVCRAVTEVAVKEARLTELKHEILNSNKLKEHFQDNPHDLQILRHDEHTRPTAIKSHMAIIPNYLVPEALAGREPPARKGKGQKRGKPTKRRRQNDQDPLTTFVFRQRQNAAADASRRGNRRNLSGRNLWKLKHKKGRWSKKKNNRKGKKDGKPKQRAKFGR